MRPAPAAPPPPARVTWYKAAYVHFGGILSPYGAGSANLSGNDESFIEKFSGGFRLSGYWAMSTRLQLGAYFNYIKGKIEDNASGYESDFEQIGVGASIKAGGLVSDRVWLGFVGDLGYYDLSFDRAPDSYKGIEISPQFHVDVLAVGAGEFKMGFFASLGPSIVPYAKASFPNGDIRIWLIAIQLRFGLTFGA
jgi:hypothetical protein